MNPRYVRRFAVIGAVCAIFLLLACGVGGKAANQLPPPTPSPTVAVPTVPPAAALQLNPTASAVKDDIAVHITGLDDAMPPTTLPTIGFNCDDHLAFTHDSVTAFSASDAENIWAYLRQTPVSQNGYPTPLSAVPLPATLQWIAGGATCHARFEISNQSSQPNRDVVIVSLGLQFTATTTANQFAYAQFPLVDLCSVISANYCSYPSGAPDDIYQADVTLGDGTNGTSVPAAITSFVDPVNYPLPIILKPGDSRSIDVNISPPASANECDLSHRPTRDHQ